MTSCDMNLPLASASATVVCVGRMSTPMMTRSSFKPQKRGTAAARQASQWAFEHPALLNQLLDDQRDGAALQARGAGQVGARNRLPGADQVEHDPAVDIADHLARRT